MKKIIGYGIGSIIVVVIAVFAYVYFAFGDLVKTAVESEGPKLTQGDVKLGGLDLSVFSGTAAINDLLIGNPKGFKTDSAVTLGKVSVALDTGSVLSDTVIIHNIQIIAPKVTYEIGTGGSNISVIQKNVAAATGAGGAKKEAKASEGGKKVVIDLLAVKGAELGFSAGLLQGKKITLPLPDFQMKGIGRDKMGKVVGASAAEVLEDFMDQLNKNVTAAIAKAGLGDLQKMGGEMLKGASGMGKDAMKGATDAGESAVKEAEGAVEGVGKSIKGLFGK